MKKKFLIGIIVIAIVVVATVLIINFANKNNKEETTDKNENNVVYSEEIKLYDPRGNLYYDSERKDEITEVKENITIQGLVELKRDDGMYLFNGQHFGEFGFEMEEYTKVNIKITNQKCVDYITGTEYDTNYIEEGDLLICTGDLLIKAYSGNQNDFDTKDNAIIVLKLSDYNKMKNEAINNERESEITVGQYFQNTNYVYIKYNITDKGYKLPFAIQAYLEEDTKIIGVIEKDKKIEIEFKDVAFDGFVLKSIKVIN